MVTDTLPVWLCSYWGSLAAQAIVLALTAAMLAAAIPRAPRPGVALIALCAAAGVAVSALAMSAFLRASDAGRAWAFAKVFAALACAELAVLCAMRQPVRRAAAGALILALAAHPFTVVTVLGGSPLIPYPPSPNPFAAVADCRRVRAAADEALAKGGEVDAASLEVPVSRELRWLSPACRLSVQEEKGRRRAVCARHR